MRETKPTIAVSGGEDAVFQSPQFGLIPLITAVKRWPDKYRHYPRGALKLLHPGSHVKVLVTSIGETTTVEEGWLMVRQLSPVRKNGKHIGEVRTQTGRSKYHGLDFGMMIYFQPSDIIDIYLNRV